MAIDRERHDDQRNADADIARHGLRPGELRRISGFNWSVME